MRPAMWTSKNGYPLSDVTLANVDTELLLAAYAAETEDANIPEMDSATRLAWRYGYMNPRTD